MALVVTATFSATTVTGWVLRAFEVDSTGTVVQKPTPTTGTATSGTITFASTPNTNNLLVVTATLDGVSLITASMSDPTNGAYAAGSSGANVAGSLFNIARYTVQAGAGNLDQTVGTTGTSAAATTNTTPAVTVASEWVLGLISIQSTTVTVSGGTMNQNGGSIGFTTDGLTPATACEDVDGYVHGNVASATYAFLETLSLSSSWLGTLSTFKLPAPQDLFVPKRPPTHYLGI